MSEIEVDDRVASPGSRINSRVLGLALLVIIALTTVVIMIQSGDDASPSATDVAEEFVDAYRVEFDIPAAFSYLAPGAVGLETQDQEEVLAEYLTAVGSKSIVAPCEVLASTAEAVQVGCPYQYHMLRSDEIGLGPYAGNSFLITVSEGQITSVELTFDDSTPDTFSTEMWNPFRSWMNRTHPEDVPVMYDGEGWRISAESIPLWEQRTIEYAQAAEQG